MCATDDSYQKARQSMAQAEEETRSRGAIVIKPGGRYVGRFDASRAATFERMRLFLERKNLVLAISWSKSDRFTHTDRWKGGGVRLEPVCLHMSGTAAFYIIYEAVCSGAH